MKKIHFQTYSRQLRGIILLLADFSAFFLALALEYLLLHFFWRSGISFVQLLQRFWTMPVAFCFIGSLTRIYGGNFFYGCSAVDPPEELKRITLISIGCYLLQLSYNSLDASFLIRRGTGGMPIVLFMILLIPAARYLVRTLMKRTGVGQMPVLIAGGGKSADMLCAELRRDRFYGYEAIGYLDDAESTDYDLRIPRLGTLSDALDVARRQKVNTLVCCIPIPVLESYREAWSEFFVQFIIVADVRVLPVNWSYPLNFNSIASVSIGNQLHWPLFRFLKILTEVVASLLGILLLGLPCLVLALLIKLTTPGPIFFVSTRLGKDGRPFKIYKFRTMYADASEKLKQLLEENPVLAQKWERDAKLDDDPRITPLGRFLRKTSLDEIPQFWNIIRGEMALIGPRPIVKEEIRHYGDAYKIVSRVKPGITGLWQVSGRSTTTYETRVRLDLFYVSNWSIWLDYYILLKTVKEVLLRRGAQ